MYALQLWCEQQQCCSTLARCTGRARCLQLLLLLLLLLYSPCLSTALPEALLLLLLIRSVPCS